MKLPVRVPTKTNTSRQKVRARAIVVGIDMVLPVGTVERRGLLLRKAGQGGKQCQTNYRRNDFECGGVHRSLRGGIVIARRKVMND